MEEGGSVERWSRVMRMCAGVEGAFEGFSFMWSTSITKYRERLAAAFLGYHLWLGGSAAALWNPKDRTFSRVGGVWVWVWREGVLVRLLVSVCVCVQKRYVHQQKQRERTQAYRL